MRGNRAGQVAVCLLTLWALIGSPAAWAKIEERTLIVGEEQHIAVPGLSSYAVENEKIITALPGRDSRSLILRAVRPGQSKIRIETRNEPSRIIEVTVTQRDPQAILRELNGMLRGYPDIQLRANGPTVLMEGSVRSEQELVNVKDIEKKFEGLVNNLVSIGPSGGRTNVMIRLDLHYVQVRRRLSRQFGVRYPQSITGAPLAGGPVANLFLTPLEAAEKITLQSEIINSLMPSLDLNEANGFIRIMRTDSIVTGNGAKAQYRDGLETYVRLVGTIGGGQLQTIFYGSELTVTPRLSASNDAVSIDLVAELSQRDPAGSQDGIPGRLIDRVETSVYVPIGQSIMLSGIDSKGTARNTTGIPWLNRIPVLGYLFGSESKDAESAYGVVYITPSLQNETNERSKRQIEQALQYFEKPSALPR